MLTTSHHTHQPDIIGVRKALLKLKPTLPTIGDALGDVDIFDLDHPHDHILFTHPALKPLTDYFIAYARNHEDASLTRIAAYVGMVGSNQFLTFLHKDPMAVRLTLTVADADNKLNPSTRTCKPIGYLENFDREHYYQSLVSQKSDTLPEEIFEPQVPEGQIVRFIRHQYHAETVLQPGTAKLFLAATI